MDITKLKTIKTSDFKKRVNALAQSAKTLSEKAHTLGVLGLMHAKEHGDFTQLSYILTVNLYGVRREAFIQWVRDFSPAVYQEKKRQFVKDKSSDANAFAIQAAADKPFWEHSKEMVAPPALDYVRFAQNLRSSMSRNVNRAKDDDNVSDEDYARILAVAEQVEATLIRVENDDTPELAEPVQVAAE